MVETQAITVRLPADVYEKLRRNAFDSKLSMSKIITEYLQIRTDPEMYGTLCALFEAAWHHTIPKSLDDLAPVTSQDARHLANLAVAAIFP